MTTLTADLEEGDLTDFDATVIDGGDLSAHADAALYGSFGLRLVIDDQTDIYGRLDFANKSEIRVGFYVHPNSLTMASSDEFIIAGGSTTPGNDDWRVMLEHDGSNYRIRAGTKNDVPAMQYTGYYTITDAKHWIEIYYKRATGAGANNGIMTLWIDGAQKESVTNIDDDTRDFDHAGLCACDIDAGTHDTFYLDHLVVNDDGTEIGEPAAVGQPMMLRATTVPHMRQWPPGMTR